MRDEGRRMKGEGRKTRRIRKCFLTGILIVLPLVITVWLLQKTFFILTDFLVAAIGHFYPLEGLKLGLLARVTSLGIIFVALVVIGALARNVFGRRLVAYFSKVCERIPVFGKIYGAVQQVIQAFAGQKKAIFQRVVLIPYPRKGLYSVAFLTSETKGEAQEKTEEDLVNVFIPTSPNPTSGMLIMVPRDDVVPLDMTVEDGMKLVVSGGALVPGYRPCKDSKSQAPNNK